MSFYVVREDAERPTGSYGPVDEDSAMYTPWQTRLDATPEQELAAGWCYGPHLSNRNAGMVLRSLGYNTDESYSYSLERGDLRGRLLTALAVGGAIADDGQPEIVSQGSGATMIDCGLPVGYFARVYEQLLDLCDQADRWQTPISVG